MKTIYVANDGMQFDDPNECREYEGKNGLRDVRMWDSSFFPWTVEGENWYENVNYIYAPSANARNTINDLFDANGCVLPFYDETENAVCVLWDDVVCEWHDVAGIIQHYKDIFYKMTHSDNEI